MAEQRLHHAQIGAVVQEMTGKGVAKNMRAHQVRAQPRGSSKNLKFAGKVLPRQVARFAEGGKQPFRLPAPCGGKQGQVRLHRGFGRFVERHHPLLVAFAANEQHARIAFCG